MQTVLLEALLRHVRVEGGWALAALAAALAEAFLGEAVPLAGT